jgi:ribosome maturation factor RimP
MTTEQLTERIATLALEKLAEPELEEQGLFLVHVRVSPTQNQITITIDGDRGVPIEGCAAVSRYVGHMLETEEAIEHAYHLTVQSPGIGTPLELPRQFEANLGRLFDITLHTGEKRNGTLAQTTETGLVINQTIKQKGSKPEEIQLNVPYSDIKEAKVEISF